MAKFLKILKKYHYKYTRLNPNLSKQLALFFNIPFLG